MKIPNKVKISGFIYDVAEVTSLCRDRNCQGESTNNSLTIKLEKTLPDSLKQSTFIHELLEQFNDVYMINLEHKQIYDLEQAFYSFIVDNPKVFERGATKLERGM